MAEPQVAVGEDCGAVEFSVEAVFFILSRQGLPGLWWYLRAVNW
jgi:hypothetical protein